MKLKIVCVNGSPRTKGNSATLARHFCETAEKAGAEVKTWFVSKLEYKGCQGCYACKNKLDRCAVKDDLAEVLEAVRACDVLVLASPVYYGDVSSQLKAFIDRTFSFVTADFVTRLAPGKKTVFILTQGDPTEGNFSDIYPRYSTFFNWMGFENSGLIRGCGVSEPGEVANRPEIMKQAEELARKIMA